MDILHGLISPVVDLERPALSLLSGPAFLLRDELHRPSNVFFKILMAMVHSLLSAHRAACGVWDYNGMILPECPETPAAAA